MIRTASDKPAVWHLLVIIAIGLFASALAVWITLRDAPRAAPAAITQPDPARPTAVDAPPPED